MTATEKITVMGVFGLLLEKPFDELNNYLPRSTIEDMAAIYSKLHREFIKDESIED